MAAPPKHASNTETHPFQAPETPQKNKKCSKTEVKPQKTKIPNTLIAAPHNMGVMVRRIFLQTLTSTQGKTKLPFITKHNSQARLKNYLQQLLNHTILLNGQPTQIYRYLTYHRGYLTYEFTMPVLIELQQKAPYTLLNLSKYLQIGSKYSQANSAPQEK